MAEFPDYATLANLEFIEKQYRHYLHNPDSVDFSWKYFFEGIDFAGFLYKRREKVESVTEIARIFDLIQAYRRYGHLQAPVNPIEETRIAEELDLANLGFAESELDQSFPTLGFCGKDTAPLKELIDALQKIYCSRIGFEYMDLGNRDLEHWIQQQIEPKLLLEITPAEKHWLLSYLNKSEIFETFLHSRYVGQTRFSLEGTETAIPILAEMIERGEERGIEEFWIGMAHRGRLNVLANILNKPYSTILEEFEDDTALSFFGNDDVKYHVGFMGEFQTKREKKVRVGFPANPSHLESVDPVLLGLVRAKQVIQNDVEREKIAPILIHGDAALAGQGVVYETMQFMRLEGYSVGGTIHLVLNNQIGYTTLPIEARSTRYCTDIAKTFGVPVLHVNAEDPESCLFAAKLCVDIRKTFKCDVFLDLLGYRKFGHNEGDEPSFTQPVQYKLIRSKKTIRQLYYEELAASGTLEKQIADLGDAEFRKTLDRSLSAAQSKEKKQAPSKQQNINPFAFVKTGVERSVLEEVVEKFCNVPPQFHLHPKLQKWLEQRKKMLEGNVDWATAEALAIGSLLLEHKSIRFSGEDTRRGTFSQRHMIWSDVENGQQYCPLCEMRESQGRFDVINSPLTEYAGLGFEYGYSCGDQSALVLWEAQYGDFNNGAQIIIDQYIANAEQKWNTVSSIALLLPHGYEGAGPEHSSARLERFLQLCAGYNMQIVNASTPAQYFHVLRRQALRTTKKPLVLLTPKSLLRTSSCVSPIRECIEGSFQEVLDDPNPPHSAQKVLLCSGKIYYDLILEREKRKNCRTAIVRIEQLYPLHEEKLHGVIKQYPEWVWVQEEPENMGAWSFLSATLGPKLKRVSRLANATPATGSHTKHKQEQKMLIDQALGE
ncbi:MAG TPA: 2-oxoglutarate dehydrogenase E1 component [Chlamydiales bacterium]|nr:2-oxoglutarate dehydrogenase E1 component [Chlamydiales bacterium]